jgi:putative sigma-54 modulation protein
MQYVIQSPRIRISDKTEIAIQEKFDRLEKVFDRILQGNIVLKKEKEDKQNYFVVEARLAVPGNDLFAREKAESFEIAAEKVVLDLESQVKKHKAKLNVRAAVPVDKLVSDEELE